MSSARTVLVSVIAGIVHAAVLLAVATCLGYSVGPSEYSLVGVAWRYAGLVVVAAVPIHLLVRRRLVRPALALVVFVLSDVQSEFTASVEDPHALYVGAWFAFLAVILVAIGVEYGLRRVGTALGSS